jgi:hypothetical protein
MGFASVASGASVAQQQCDCIDRRLLHSVPVSTHQESAMAASDLALPLSADLPLGVSCLNA